MSNTALKIGLVALIAINVVLVYWTASTGQVLLMVINMILAGINGWNLGRVWDL